MRDHIFRGVRLDGKGWVKGSLSHFKDENGKTVALIIEPNKHGHVGRRDEFLVDPETVGEFTGLTSNNDTMIFEGDIVTRFGEYVVYFGVCPETGITCFYLIGTDHNTFTTYDMICSHSYEITGTIHDSDSGEG